jgi:hypothetical protein
MVYARDNLTLNEKYIQAKYLEPKKYSLLVRKNESFQWEEISDCSHLT